MSENPFSNFDIEMPKKYDEQIRVYCMTGGAGKSREQSPFDRQIDFWYCAFLLAVKHKLSPVLEKDTYKVIAGTILGTDSYRITHIQAAYLAITEDFDGLADNRKVFDFALTMANAGIAKLLQVLGDTDQKPLWNILDEVENGLVKSK
jgi:hypothetical protein